MFSPSDPFEPWWTREFRLARERGSSITRVLFGLALLGILPACVVVGVTVGALS